MSEPVFDDWSDAYEAMIDWPKRLANEEPFYRRLFERAGAQRVLDAACGTGRHAALFHSWGLTVEGADISPAMIERCRQRFGESETLRWAVRGFDQPHPDPGSFDVAICTGNSLALAGDEVMATEALRQMVAAVRPGGAVVVGVLNLWRLPDGPVSWQKCIRAALPQGNSLIIKGVHRAGRTGYVDMIVTRMDAGGQASGSSAGSSAPGMRSESVRFIGLEASQIGQMFRRAGAARIELYGDYQSRPFEPERSPDLIAVGVRE